MAASHIAQLIIGLIILSPNLLVPLIWRYRIKHSTITFHRLNHALWTIFGINIFTGWWGFPLVLESLWQHQNLRGLEGLAVIFSRSTGIPGLVVFSAGLLFYHYFIPTLLPLRLNFQSQAIPSWIFADPDLTAWQQEHPQGDRSTAILCQLIKLSTTTFIIPFTFLVGQTLIIKIISTNSTIFHDYVFHLMLWGAHF